MFLFVRCLYKNTVFGFSVNGKKVINAERKCTIFQCTKKTEALKYGVSVTIKKNKKNSCLSAQTLSESIFR